MEKQTRDYSREEYISLRNEIIARIGLLNSQVSTITAAMIAIYSLSVALLVIPYQYGILNISVIEFIVIREIQCFSLLFPMPILYSASIKSGENIQQIMAISCYIRTFYENYPPMNKSSDLHWETVNNALSDVSVDRGESSKRMKQINNEYIGLSVVSLILYTAFEIHTFISISGRTHLSAYILLTTILLCGISVGVIYSILIYQSSSIKRIMEYTEEYMNNLITYMAQEKYISWMDAKIYQSYQKKIINLPENR